MGTQPQRAAPSYTFWAWDLARSASGEAPAHTPACFAFCQRMAVLKALSPLSGTLGDTV